jgi:GNAT superfamily N-acetyltransferase
VTINIYPGATKKYIYHPSRFPKIAVDGDEVVGVMILSLEALNSVYIHDLVVKVSRRDEGIGRRLLGHAEALAKKLSGRVALHGMRKSVEFYQRCGYKITKRYKFGCRMLKNCSEKAV